LNNTIQGELISRPAECRIESKWKKSVYERNYDMKKVTDLPAASSNAAKNQNRK